MCAMNVADWIEVLTSKEHWRIQNIEEGWGGKGAKGVEHGEGISPAQTPPHYG